MATVTWVLDCAAQMEEALQRLGDAAARHGAEARGWFTPSEDEVLRADWLRYWRLRIALLDQLAVWRRSGVGDPLPRQLGLAAAMVLVDAGRRLRHELHDDRLLRRKLNEGDLVLGLPARSYDRVQRHLTAARTIWSLVDLREEVTDLLRGPAQGERAAVQELIRRLLPCLTVSKRLLLRAHLRSRLRRIGVAIGRRGLQRGVHAVQELLSTLIGELATRPGHEPCLALGSDAALRRLLRAGDVIVNRKEHRLTTALLPGFWPHAALVADHAGAGLVYEALGDGVKERPLASALAADRLCVLRPVLQAADLTRVLERARSHLGKPYDFDFDCRRSDRLVCSELVFRSFEGLPGMVFEPAIRVGRLTVAPQDLVALACAGRGFDLLATVAEPGGAVLVGEAARAAVQPTLG